MIMNDTLSDMFARIKNGQKNRSLIIEHINTKFCVNVLKVLYKEGYIRGYRYLKNDPRKIEILLKYHNNEPVIKEIIRVSKPGRRVYLPVKKLSKVYNGLGILLLSTSKGILSDNMARKINVGGEVLCKIF